MTFAKLNVGSVMGLELFFIGSQTAVMEMHKNDTICKLIFPIKIEEDYSLEELINVDVKAMWNVVVINVTNDASMNEWIFSKGSKNVSKNKTT